MILPMIVLALSAACSALAGPVAGCHDLAVPGTWSQSISDNGDTATTLGNGSTYQFILGSPEVQADPTGEWDAVETFTNGTLIVNNAPSAPWFNPCEETNQFEVEVSQLLVKIRSTRYEATNAGYMELELSAQGSWFTYLAGYAGFPTVTNVPADTNAGIAAYTLTTVPLDGARLCLGQVIKVDIRPGAGPNPLNVKSRGVLPVAIRCMTNLNVGAIDLSSLRLQCVPPLRVQCTGPRNAPKALMLKFDTQAIVQNLPSDNDREVVPLVLTGQLKDGTPISGTDTVVVLNKGKPAKHPNPGKGHGKDH
jgi:hypothetical protein